MNVRRGQPGARRAGDRRAMVLLTVLLVVAIGALAGMSVLTLADARMEGVHGTLARGQVRALAWSGVQAAMAEMLEQREKLLDGEAPELTREWTLFTDGAGRSGVVRLLAMRGDEVAVAEAGKLDVNTASAEMLERLGVFDRETADRIVAARSERRFASVAELAGVEGIMPEMLRASDGEGTDEGRSLADLLTVFSFDPNIQAGMGEDASRHRGRRRVNLHQEWSEKLKEALADRFGSGIANGIETLVKRGQKFDSVGEIVRVMRGAGVGPEEWGPALDALTVSPDPYIPGLVDLSSAPAQVLACVPGIDETAAAEIVAARSRLDAATRASVAWPVVQGILKPDAFETAVDHLTTRSMQWRIRVEAGFAAPGAAETSEGEAPETLRDRMVLEAVIDVASQRPRVAYLRDVTYLDLAYELAAMAQAGEEREDAPLAEGESGVFQEDEEFADTFGDLDFGGDELADAADLSFGEWSDDSLVSPGSGEGAIGSADRSETGAEGTETEGADRRLGRWTSGEGDER